MKNVVPSRYLSKTLNFKFKGHLTFFTIVKFIFIYIPYFLQTLNDSIERVIYGVKVERYVHRSIDTASRLQSKLIAVLTLHNFRCTSRIVIARVRDFCKVT